MIYNKDQLTDYMVQGHVHLSKKDYGFFNNIKYQIQQNKPITSNQNKLFDKLLLKYKRQLQKLGFDSLELQNYNWKHSIVETESQYLEAKISILDNKILIQSPFNTQFISQFRKKANSIFVWSKKDKAYIGEYNTYSLKIAIEYVNKFYDKVKYCSQTENLLDQIEPYKDCKYWHPTLIKVQNNFYIVATTSIIMDVINDITLSDDPKLIHMLSRYGIKIDDSVLTDDLSRFASDFFTTFDLDKLDVLAGYLTKLDIITVVLARDIVYNKQISNEIRYAMEANNIICTSSLDAIKGKAAMLHYNRLIDNDEMSKGSISKFITLVNSRPIPIK